MTREGLAYDAALRQAQELGYAEADPTLDVDGTDTAHKLAILAQLAFGASVTTGQIPRAGDRPAPTRRHPVRRRTGLHGQAAGPGQAVGSGAGAAGRARRWSSRGRPLAEVRGPYNAIRVVGDAVGDTLFYGRGAGMMPTASAVVGDLIDVVVGRAALTSRALNLWADVGPAPPDPRQPGPEPLLPPVHDRRPAGRARRDRAGARRRTPSASPASSSTTPATTPPTTAPCRSSS